MAERLQQRFGSQQVFMDVDSITPGANFVEKIEESIGSCGVVLALIGHDWLSRRGEERLLEDPSDFVRLELATAIERQIPIIPILVERTSMPKAVDLPEVLRTVTQVQALELENVRWEYDVSQLIRAVEPLVGTAPAEVEPAKRKDEKPPGRRRVVIGAAAAGIAIVGAALAFLLSRSSPIDLAPHLQGLAPEALTSRLLTDPFTPAEIAPGLSAPGVKIVLDRFPGLVAAIRASFPGPDASDVVFFDVFDTADHARGVFPGLIGLGGFQQTGTFGASGIAGTVRCISSHRPAAQGLVEQSASTCGILSGNVVIQASAIESTSGGATNRDLAIAMLKSAVRHAIRSADGARGATVRFGIFTPSQIQPAGFDPSIVPGELSGPTLAALDRLPADPAGLERRLSATFTRADKADLEDYVFFNVFVTEATAKAWFDLGLIPTGSTVNETIDSSGFAEPTYCKAVTKPATAPSTRDKGISACFVLVRNVVVESYTSSSTDTKKGNNAMTLTLARSAVMHLLRLSGSRG